MNLDDGKAGNNMRRLDVAIPLILGILVFLFLLDLMLGSVNIPPNAFFKILTGGTVKVTWMNIFWDWRMPKAITTVFAGGALALSGLLMQTYFRNPLADPYILGISSGASLGVALVMMSAGIFGVGTIFTNGLISGISISMAAILGAFAVLLLILLISAKIKSNTTILILGIMHCPRSCALMIYEKLLVTEQQSTLRFGHHYKAGMMERLVTTDLNDEDFIFGGEKKLHDTLKSVIGNGYKTIFIITACPPGLIGDDIGKVSASILESNPDIRIISIKVDGNLVGDGLQGRMNALLATAGLISPGTPSNKERSVNIIAEKWGVANTETDITEVRDLLERLGIVINCRFIGSTDTGSITRFNDAMLNLPVEQDEKIEGIKKMLAPFSNVPFLDKPLPTGFNETSNWLLAIAQVFGEEEKARQIIADEGVIYRKRIADLRLKLEGKTLLISTSPKSFDWVCDLAMDLRMKILKIGLTYSPFSDSVASRYADRFTVVQNYTVEMRSEDIRLLQPDLVLLTYPALKPSDHVKSAPIPYCPGIGFSAGVEQAERWIQMMRTHTVGWKADEEGLL